jgi:hypothetical protein
MRPPASRSAEVRPASATLRQCPTLPAHGRQLIEHRIESAQCLERQRTQYHKCHRCVYRGKPAGFVIGEQTRNGSPNGVGPRSR